MKFDTGQPGIKSHPILVFLPLTGTVYDAHLGRHPVGIPDSFGNGVIGSMRAAEPWQSLYTPMAHRREGCVGIEQDFVD